MAKRSGYLEYLYKKHKEQQEMNSSIFYDPNEIIMVMSILSLQSLDENFDLCMEEFVNSSMFERDIVLLKNFFNKAFKLKEKEFEAVQRVFDELSTRYKISGLESARKWYLEHYPANEQGNSQFFAGSNEEILKLFDEVMFEIRPEYVDEYKLLNLFEKQG